MAQHPTILPDFPPEQGTADDVCIHDTTPTPYHVLPQLPSPILISGRRLSRSPSVRSCRTRRSLSRSPERFQSLPHDTSHYSSPSSTVTEDVGAQLPTKIPGRVFESWFKAILAQYEKEFESGERHWAARFNHAESERDNAERERSRLFRQRESARNGRFSEMMSLQCDQYDTQKRAHNAGEDWRNEQFEGAMERHSWFFEQAQENVQKQYSAMDTMEDAFLRVMKIRVEKLNKAQEKSFEEARERRSIAFVKSQIRREAELGTTRQMSMASSSVCSPPPQQSPLPGLVHPKLQISPPPHCGGVLPEAGHWYRPHPGRTRYSRSRSYSPIQRRRTAGFVGLNSVKMI